MLHFWIYNCKNYCKNIFEKFLMWSRETQTCSWHKTRRCLKRVCPRVWPNSVRAITRPSARGLKYLCNPNDPESGHSLDMWYLSSLATGMNSSGWHNACHEETRRRKARTSRLKFAKWGGTKRNNEDLVGRPSPGRPREERFYRVYRDFM